MYSFYRLPPAGAALSHPTRCSEWFAGHFNLFCFLSMFFLFGLKPWVSVSYAFNPLLYATPDPTRGWEQATPGTADASIKHLTTASLHDFLVLISLALKIHLLELRFLIWSNKFKSWQTLYETKVTLSVAMSLQANIKPSISPQTPLLHNSASTAKADMAGALLPCLHVCSPAKAVSLCPAWLALMSPERKVTSNLRLLCFP